MKKIVIVITALLCCTFSNAQKEASNWYFGNNAGISFDIDAGTVTAVNDGLLFTEEGCTTISNSNGELLFYTNGEIVYDRFGNIMPNGTGLLGSQSSTQSAIIIPKPGDLDVYYIFTQDTEFQGPDLGFNYSEVNMNLNNGLGAIVAANKNTPLLSSATEKLSAVLKDCQSANILVATQVNDLGGNDLFYIYEVSNSGVVLLGTPSNTGFSTNGNGRGYLKFSPDGTKLVSANVRDGIYIYDFDVNTGTVSLPIPITISNSNLNLNGAIYPYGVEFSPNSQLLYVSTYNDFFNNNQQENNNPSNHNSALLQYDLSSNDFTTINASVVPLETKQGYRSALQLGPDGKIYKTESQTYNAGLPNLSTIESPNTLGTGCNYTLNTVTLTSNSRQGLPPFITSFFSEDIDIIQNGNNTTNLPLCIGENYTLIAENIPNANYTWTKDGIPLAESDFDLIITTPGTYNVKIEVSGDTCGLLEGEAIVTYFDIPIATQPDNIQACDDDNNGTTSFNFSTQTTTILNGQDSTVFAVEYYETITDAQANNNAIINEFQNTSNPQIIYAKVSNFNNRACFDITSFQIEVFDTPVITSSNDFEICDNDANPMDGQTEITLSDFNADILGSQDSTQFTISYYGSQTDADDAINNHPNTYTNQTPITEALFIRIENNNNTDCYSTESINLVINPIPEAFDTDIYQCDEQGMVDGFTTFNLTQADIELTGNAPDTSTKFYLTLDDAQNNNNEINRNAYTNTSNPQNIFVRVTNNLTNCTNFSLLTLETSDTQINNYTAEPVCEELDSGNGISIFNLDDFSTDILAGLSAGLSISYYENANDALLENNPISSPYQNTTPYAQTIYVRVENDNACYGINEVFLTVNTIPPLDNDETVVYCLNDFPTTINLDAGLNDSSNNYSFSWSNSESTETIDINTTGSYTVTVTNNTTLCSKNRTINVEPSNIATIETVEITDGNINNNIITILTSGEGDYQYALTDQDLNTTPFQDSNVFTQLLPGIYTIAIRDIKNNCGVTNQNISVIGFPLFFTPNGDTFNDTWQVYGVSNVFQPNSKILIFDRFGKLITQINPSGIGWDGTFNGKALPQSDYWFLVKLQDGREYKNHFTLRR